MELTPGALEGLCPKCMGQVTFDIRWRQFMKMLWKKSMLSLACLPLLGLPGGAGGQVVGMNGPEGLGRATVTPASQLPVGSPRSGMRQTPGFPSQWSRAEANESSPGTGLNHLMTHGIVLATENGPAGDTSGRSFMANRERPPGVPRSLSSEPYAYHYRANVPCPRSGYTPVSRCLPACSEAAEVSCLRGVASGLRRIGTGIAALFGLGAWGASRGRKEP